MKSILSTFILLFFSGYISAQETKDSCVTYDSTYKKTKITCDTSYMPYKSCSGWWIFKSCKTIEMPVYTPKTIYYDTTVKKTKCWQVPIPIPHGGYPTIFGFMQEGAAGQELENISKSVGVPLIRAAIYFSKETNKKIIDEYLKDGFNVQINFNYKSTATKVLFPTDTAFIRSRAETFFKYYLPYKKQIPLIVCENEWDNDRYRDFTKTTVHDYLNELRIVTQVAHKYGFKITDAGITGTALARWYYSQLSGEQAKEWRQKYFVGETMPNYQPMLQIVAAFVSGIKNIPIDYLNAHWYNIDSSYGGFTYALTQYGILCGKTEFVNNEFGIRALKSNTNIPFLWKQTIKEMLQANLHFAIAYSGTGRDGLALELNNEMLSLLK